MRRMQIALRRCVPIVHISTAPSQHLPPVPHLFHHARMGNKRFDTIFDFQRWGHAMEVRCSCVHTGVLDAAYVVERFMTKRWPTNSLATAGDHLRCSACGGRPMRIGPAMR